MLRNVTSSLYKVTKTVALSRSAPVTVQIQNFGTAEKKGSVLDAWNKSCYHEMDFSISEEATVFEAVERMSAYDVGALVTTDAAGESVAYCVYSVSTRSCEYLL